MLPDHATSTKTLQVVHDETKGVSTQDPKSCFAMFAIYWLELLNLYNTMKLHIAKAMIGYFVPNICACQSNKERTSTVNSEFAFKSNNRLSRRSIEIHFSLFSIVLDPT